MKKKKILRILPSFLTHLHYIHRRVEDASRNIWEVFRLKVVFPKKRSDKDVWQGPKFVSDIAITC